MVGIGRKALEEGWDALPKIREGLGGPGEVESPFLRPGGVRRSYWRAGRGLEALPLGQEGYGSPLGGLGMVGRPSQRAGRSRRPSRRAGRGQESLSVCWKSLPKCRESWEAFPQGRRCRAEVDGNLMATQNLTDVQAAAWKID